MSNWQKAAISSSTERKKYVTITQTLCNSTGWQKKVTTRRSARKFRTVSVIHLVRTFWYISFYHLFSFSGTCTAPAHNHDSIARETVQETWPQGTLVGLHTANTIVSFDELQQVGICMYIQHTTLRDRCSYITAGGNWLLSALIAADHRREHPLFPTTTSKNVQRLCQSMLKVRNSLDLLMLVWLVGRESNTHPNMQNITV